MERRLYNARWFTRQHPGAGWIDEHTGKQVDAHKCRLINEEGEPEDSAVARQAARQAYKATVVEYGKFGTRRLGGPLYLDPNVGRIAARLDPQVRKIFQPIVCLGYYFTDKPDEWHGRFYSAKVRGRHEAPLRLFSTVVQADWFKPADGRTLLLSAIPSKELQLPPDHALAQIGSAIAIRLGWDWAPTLLSKNPHEPIHFQHGGLAARDAILRDADYRCKPIKREVQRVVILDDFITTGSTINLIARAVLKSAPHLRILGAVAMARTESISWAGEQGITLSNDSIPAHWVAIWDGHPPALEPVQRQVGAVLFDLDDTLVRTDMLKLYRQQKRWNEAERRFPETKVYPGVAELLSALRQRGVKVGVVTKSPDQVYAIPLLRHHRLAYDVLIGYHQVGGLVKPHPRGAQLALAQLGLSPTGAIGVGDDGPDHGCFTAAGLAGAYGAGWSHVLDRGPAWQKVLNQPGELLQLL